MASVSASRVAAAPASATTFASTRSRVSATALRLRRWRRDAQRPERLAKPHPRLRRPEGFPLSRRHGPRLRGDADARASTSSIPTRRNPAAAAPASPRKLLTYRGGAANVDQMEIHPVVRYSVGTGLLHHSPGAKRLDQHHATTWSDSLIDLSSWLTAGLLWGTCMWFTTWKRTLEKQQRRD